MKKLTAALVLIALLVGASLFYKYKIPHNVVLADAKLTDLNGEPVNLNQFKNKKLFVNFFATWCGPCVMEMPELNKAAQVLEKDGFVFICVSDEPIERLRYFSQQYAGALRVYQTSKKLDSLGVHSFPTSYLFKPDGKIAYKKIGTQEWGSEEMIETLKKAE